jgi:hypothetical protein
MRLRGALTAFLVKAGLAGHMPKISFCGPRQQAYKYYAAALGENKLGCF